MCNYLYLTYCGQEVSLLILSQSQSLLPDQHLQHSRSASRAHVSIHKLISTQSGLGVFFDVQVYVKTQGRANQSS